MGMLDQMRQAQPELTIVDEAAPVPAEVFEKPVPPSLVETPVKKHMDIKFKRDPGTGLIESATGYDRDGQLVKFSFERDGRRKLEKIKVKR